MSVMVPGCLSNQHSHSVQCSKNCTGRATLSETVSVQETPPAEKAVPGNPKIEVVLPEPHLVLSLVGRCSNPIHQPRGSSIVMIGSLGRWTVSRRRSGPDIKDVMFHLHIMAHRACRARRRGRALTYFPFMSSIHSLSHHSCCYNRQSENTSLVTTQMYDQMWGLLCGA